MITPPIISAQGGSDAELQHQNCTAVATAANAAIVFLNTAAAAANCFWHKDSIEILPGRYAVPASPSPALDALASRFDGPLALGVDFAKARRVVSFGAPVLTDAGTPGLLARLRAESRRRPLAERLEVVHLGATRTKSAGLADRFVPIAPGTEAALALGLVHVLLDEKLADAAFLAARTTRLAELEALAARFAPALVEQKTGVPAGDVVATASLDRTARLWNLSLPCKVPYVP